MASKVVVVRNVTRDEYKGYRIDLFSGWDRRGEQHYFHLYMQRVDERGRPVGHREKVDGTAEALT